MSLEGCHQWWASKECEPLEFYADASAFNRETGVAAIADGVSETILCGEWADLLVTRFVDLPPEQFSPPAVLAWLTEPRAEFTRGLVEWASHKAYYHQRKARQEGAQATFLGFRVTRAPGDPAPAAVWQAVAVGDCCLFHWRQGHCIRTWPITKVEAFGRTPRVIGNYPQPEESEQAIQSTEGDCLPGDFFFLTTDAMGEFLLKHLQRITAPDAFLTTSASSWADWLADQRTQKLIRNDDVTLLALWLPDESDRYPRTGSLPSMRKTIPKGASPDAVREQETGAAGGSESPEVCKAVNPGSPAPDMAAAAESQQSHPHAADVSLSTISDDCKTDHLEAKIKVLQEAVEGLRNELGDVRQRLQSIESTPSPARVLLSFLPWRDQRSRD